MSRKLLFLISLVAVMCIGGVLSAEERWTRNDSPGIEMDWNDSYTWWDDPVPTSADDAHIDAWRTIVSLDGSGVCGMLYVGDWETQWDPCQPRLRIYAGANLLVTNSIMDGNFELGIQPYMDWGVAEWGNFGWGVVDMNGGTVTVEGNLAVGVNGAGSFYLMGGTIKAESFSMGTPRNATIEEDPDRLVDFDFTGIDNIMDVAGGKLILAGDIAGLEPRVVPYGTRGYLVFSYEADEAGYTTITAIPDYNIAWLPSPADGVIDVPLDSNLAWLAGDHAQASNGHEVYFGTSFTEVDDATPETPGIYRGSSDVGSYPDPCDANVTIYTYDPGPLDWATTYYWRIDEVNETNTTWKGKVWRFSTPMPTASNPNPANRAEDLSLLTDLSWTPGAQAVSHEVYFSTNFDDVADANSSVMTDESEASHDPGVLEFSTTYYWRVDEVNLSAATQRWAGDVWSFTTAEYLVVDDMDSYQSGVKEIYDTWVDGYTTEDNGSWVRLDGTIVLGGNSMWYVYDNSTKWSQQYGYGSEIEASTAALECGADWAVGDAKSLIVPFYGQTGNSTTVNDRMYVALKDVNDVDVVVYYPDVNDINKAEWQEWNIDLTDSAFSVLQMNNITTVYLGFGIHGGDKDAVGGYGVVYFDDIRIYPRRCRAELVAADFNGDCVADIWDLDALANNWLVSGNYLVYAEPAPNNASGGLLAWYKFDETESTIAYDSSGNGYDAPVNVDFGWDPTGGFDGNSCLYTAGGIIVDVPNEVLYDRLPMEEITISLWLKPEFLSHTDWTCPFAGGTDGDWWLITAMSLNYIPTEPGYYVSFYGPSHPGWMEGFEFLDLDTSGSEGWHHYAFWKDSTQGLMRIYRDGALFAETDGTDTPIRALNPDNHEFLIGTVYSPLYGWGDWQGWIDDFRIYDHVLPHSQILDLAGQESIIQPFPQEATDMDVKEDGIISFGDYAIMANGWLEEQLWP